MQSQKTFSRTLKTFILLACISSFSVAGFAQVKNVVLVHGAFADGSGWESVQKILVGHGFNVTIVQNPNTGLAEDVAATKRILALQKGQVVLVGHSYGGAIITEAGDTSSVSSLVYVAAFVPDAGESLLKMFQAGPPNPTSGILPPFKGYIWYDKAKFHKDFCADLPADKAAFMAVAQVPVALSCFATDITKPTWKTKPSWYVLTTEDRMVPPDAQRGMAGRAKSTITEIKASHVVYMTHAKEVAAVIEAAAQAK